MELCSYISCCAVSLKAPTSCCPRDLCTVAISQKWVFRSPALICMGRPPPRKLREADGWDKSTSWPHTHDGFPADMNAGIDQCRLLRFIRDVDNKLHRQWETHAHFQWSAELKQKHHNQILFLNVCIQTICSDVLKAIQATLLLLLQLLLYKCYVFIEIQIWNGTKIKYRLSGHAIWNNLLECV